MDSTQVNETFLQNGWSIYLISFLVLIALFFIQKYAYLIDVKLNEFSKKNSTWTGKPWFLWLALVLGLALLFTNFFSQDGLEKNPALWGWIEWILLLSAINGILILAVESYQHFGFSIGLIRLIIFTLLMVGFFYAGFLVGFLILALIALGALFYFIRYWRKLMVIK